MALVRYAIARALERAGVSNVTTDDPDRVRIEAALHRLSPPGLSDEIQTG